MASYWECEACHGRLIMASSDGHTVMLDYARDPEGEIGRAHV